MRNSKQLLCFRYVFDIELHARLGIVAIATGPTTVIGFDHRQSSALFYESVKAVDCRGSCLFDAICPYRVDCHADLKLGMIVIIVSRSMLFGQRTAAGLVHFDDSLTTECT